MKRSMYVREQRQAVSGTWIGKATGVRHATLTQPDGRIRVWKLTPTADGTVRAEREDGL